MVSETNNDANFSPLIKAISTAPTLSKEEEEQEERKKLEEEEAGNSNTSLFLTSLPILDKCISYLSAALPTIFSLACFTILSFLQSFFQSTKKSSKISLQKWVSMPFCRHKSWPGILCTTLLALSFQWAGVTSLKITSLEVPPHHVSGKPVILLCYYQLDDDVLYSVKWYRGNSEFFRYVPGDQLPMRIFDVPGVIVDTAVSDKNRVTLRSVTREASGKYKCEVSADEPSFHTVSKTAEMLVVDLPKTVPNISGGRTRYHVSDEVHVNCTSGKSRPAASLMWYINDKQAKIEDLEEYAPVQDDDGLEISRLGLKFFVGAKDFPNGVLKIRCTATIAAVYWQSSEESVEGQLPQTSPALESKGVYTGSNAGVNSSMLLLFSSKLCQAFISRFLFSR